MNSKQIRAKLAEDFFRGVASPERELLRLRNLAATIGKPDSPEISAIVEKSADAVEEIVSAPKPTISESAKPVDALREKTRSEIIFSDFEAAYALQTANGAKPEYVTFETVVDSVSRSYRLSYAVAKSIMIPPVRMIRIMSLQRLIFPGEYFE